MPDAAGSPRPIVDALPRPAAAGLRLSTVASAAAIGEDAWRHLAPAGHPFLGADFLACAENHGAAGKAWGWQAEHLLAHDADGTLVGILPLYRKSNGYGDFTGDWQWAGAYRQLERAYYPKLSSGLPHTPVGGPRLLVGAAPATAVREALIAGAKAIVAEQGLSSWHVALPTTEELELLATQGLLLSHDVQFHWCDAGYGDFAGFLAAFAADKRRKIRAERRQATLGGLAIETRHGDEIDAHEWPRLHALYASTFDKFSNHAVFSAACLGELAARLGRRMVAFIARQGADAVAVALCFRDDVALYGRYWGCFGHYPALHFELCFYQGIDYCLRQGLRRFEPGAGGEHKIARGFVPTLVRSAHWIADPRMRGLIARHLDDQRAAVAAYRDEAMRHLPFRQDAVGHALPRV